MAANRDVCLPERATLWEGVGPSPAYASWVAPLLMIALIFAVRVGLAATTPLSFDEALYWRYSRHLAAGYIDHPFLNPLGIRAGVTLLGDTPLGVRLASLLTSVLASWAIWSASRTLFDDRKLALTAVLLANVTLVFAVGSMIATSDEMVVTTSSLLLAGLAKVEKTQQGPWWLVVGGAIGAGLCAKYTTAFLALGVVGWTLWRPEARRWIRNVWTWAGALLAILIFFPVLAWNAQHKWASFVYQAGRMTVFHLTLRFVAEYLGAMVVLVTPGVFALGAVGLWRIATGESAGRGAWLVTLVLPLSLYLLWHSTHQRVQGNWFEPITPALCVAAAYAVCRSSWAGSQPRFAARALGGSLACAAVMIALAYLAIAGLTPRLSAHDLRARAFGVGWTPLGQSVADAARRQGATIVLTTDYTLASWGRYYIPWPGPIAQIDERVRWANEPAPPSQALGGPALYICKEPCTKAWKAQSRFARSQLVAHLQRVSRDQVVDRYRLYRLDAPTRAMLDPQNHLPLADHPE